MALSLSSQLILEKNKLETNSAWIVLVEITLSDSTVINLSSDNQETTFESKTWIPYPFQIDAMTANSQGEIPSIQLRISNVARLLQEYIETFNGGVGATVRILVVNSDNL